MNRKLQRREMLQWSSSALLLNQFWPGWANSQEKAPAEFSFIVVNDLHFQTEKCPTFFARVMKQMNDQIEKPRFVLVAGDLAQDGTEKELSGIKESLKKLQMPYFVTPGNHDYTPKNDRTIYEKLFPKSLNYYFEEGGITWLIIDSTEGTKYNNTTINKDTLVWLDATLPKLDKTKPMVLLTHFPLAAKVTYCPKNAEEVLKRFRDYPLRAVFSGHFHGTTENESGGVLLSTNVCCAISRNNHNSQKEKGYLLVTVKNGKLKKKFVAVETTIL
ncbi:MAG: metallophosphoesterase [Zavarzinella sp.]